MSGAGPEISKPAEVAFMPVSSSSQWAHNLQANTLTFKILLTVEKKKLQYITMWGYQYFANMCHLSACPILTG